MVRRIAAALALSLWTTLALAQSSPNLITGQVPTAGQWNGYFAAKQDALGYVPVNKAGDVMTGKLVTIAPTTSGAGFNLRPGTAPSFPTNGDIWTSTAGLFVQINGVTIGPLSGGTSSSFAGTSPLTVSFPAGVVTYAFDFTVANTFLAQQTDQGATTTSPGWYAKITGDTVPRVRVGLNATDIGSIAFGPGNANRDAFIERAGAASIRFGSPDAATAIAQTLGVQNVVAGTSNTAGAALTIAGSQGTGTGAGGSIIFKVAPAGSTGSSQNALAAALTLDSTKLATFGGHLLVEGVTSTGATGTGNFVFGTLPSISGLTVTGSFTATGLVTNADLVNASTTVNGVPCTLGSTCTVTASAAAITVGTTTIGSGTPNGLLYDNGGLLGNLATANGGILNTSATGVPSITATPVLGLAGTTVGTLGFQNASTGTLTLTPPTGALGTVTLTLPAATDTLVARSTTDTLSNKTLASPAFSGTFSGTYTIAGTPTLSGTFAGTPTFSGANFISRANLAQVAASSLIGNPTGSLANESAITLGSTLSFSGAALQTGAGTGDVAWSANSFSTTIQANAVTYAKFQQVAAVSLVGNPTGSLANAQGITLGSTLGFSGTTLNCTIGTTLLFGCLKPDGVTITVAAGVITASGASATSITVGTTSIVSGTPNSYFYDNAGVLGNKVIPFSDVTDAAPVDALAAVNALINGDHVVSQQNGTANVTGITNTTTYIDDQWTVVLTAFRTVSAQVLTGGPNGLPNFLRVTMPASTASPGAGDYLYIAQPIEGYRMQKFAFGTAGSFTATFGAWIRASVTGSYSVSLVSSGGDRAWPFQCAVTAATWTYCGTTTTVQTGGTWGSNTSVGAFIRVGISAGSTTTCASSAAWNSANCVQVTGDTNLAGTASAALDVTGAFLVPGSYTISSARAPFIMRPFDQELLVAKRYWECSYDYGTSPGTVTTNGVVDSLFNVTASVLTTRFTVPKRNTSAITTYNPTSGATGTWRDTTNSADRATTPTEIGFNSFITFVASISTSADVIGHWCANARM